MTYSYKINNIADNGFTLEIKSSNHSGTAFIGLTKPPKNISLNTTEEVTDYIQQSLNRLEQLDYLEFYFNREESCDDTFLKTMLNKDFLDLEFDQYYIDRGRVNKIIRETEGDLNFEGTSIVTYKNREFLAITRELNNLVAISMLEESAKIRSLNKVSGSYIVELTYLEILELIKIMVRYRQQVYQKAFDRIDILE